MPASEWAKMVSAISRLAETIFATRESAYNRKLDKRQEKAIQCAEEMIEKLHILFNFIFERVEIKDGEKKEYDRLKLLIHRKINQFNKYD